MLLNIRNGLKKKQAKICDIFAPYQYMHSWIYWKTVLEKKQANESTILFSTPHFTSTLNNNLRLNSLSRFIYILYYDWFFSNKLSTQQNKEATLSYKTCSNLNLTLPWPRPYIYRRAWILIGKLSQKKFSRKK